MEQPLDTIHHEDHTRQNPLDEPPWSPELLDTIAQLGHVWLCHDQDDAALLLRPDAGDLPALCVPIHRVDLLTAKLVKPLQAIYVMQRCDDLVGDGFYAKYVLKVRQQLERVIDGTKTLALITLNEITSTLPRLWASPPVLEDRQRFQFELVNLQQSGFTEEIRPTRRVPKAETPAAESWEIFSLEDAYRPREPPVELVEGLLEVPSLVIVYGAPGSFKTLLLMDMLMCIAGGLPWLRPLDTRAGLPREIQQAPVLWVDFDNGPRRMHERVAALARAYHLPAETPFHYVSMPSPWLNASTTAGMTPLDAAVEQYEPKAIVLDNLLLIKGNVDENSAEMGIVMAHLRQLTERCEGVVMPIHHQRKDHGNGGRAGDRLRGHSSIESAVDLALLVEREEGSSEIMIKSTKTRGVDVLPFGAMFTYEHQLGTHELREARFYGRMIVDESSDRAVEGVIREVLKEHSELLTMELCARVHGLLPKLGVQRIRGVVERMASQHHLRRRPGPKGGEYFSLAARRL